MNQIERGIALIISHSRWLIAPFLIGLVIGLMGLLYKFVLKLGTFLTAIQTAPEDEIIVGLLKLIDLSLTANLILIVISAGYMNYIALSSAEEQVEWATRTCRNWICRPQTEAARLHYCDCSRQCAGMVHGYRQERRQHEAGLGCGHPSCVCSGDAFAGDRGPAEQRPG